MSLRRLLICLGKQDTYADPTAVNRETVYSGNWMVNEVVQWDRFVPAQIYGPVSPGVYFRRRNTGQVRTATKHA